MPMHYEIEKSPAGRNYLRMVSSGVVSAEDVDKFGVLIGPGQPYDKLPILSFIEPGADFSPQARKRFGALGAGPEGDRIPTAVVVTSTPLRVLLSFILKVAGASASSKFFANEADARAWLFERMDARADAATS